NRHRGPRDLDDDPSQFVVVRPLQLPDPRDGIALEPRAGVRAAGDLPGHRLEVSRPVSRSREATWLGRATLAATNSVSNRPLGSRHAAHAIPCGSAKGTRA